MTDEDFFQVADWNCKSGERWVAYQTQLDAMMAVFGRAAIEATAPAKGERVLDVDCGAGATSLDFANCVGANGHVLGVDISEPLINKARALAPKDAPALFEAADASSIDLPEGTFDSGIRSYALSAQAGRTGRIRLLARNGRERLGALANDRGQGHPPGHRAARSRSARPVFVWRPGAGCAHFEGRWLHRCHVHAVRCLYPVWKGGDARRGD